MRNILRLVMVAALLFTTASTGLPGEDSLARATIDNAIKATGGA